MCRRKKSNCLSIMYVNLLLNLLHSAFQAWVRRPDYKRPQRICPYCSQDQTRLRRHLVAKHGEEPDVVAALKLPQSEQQTAFDNIKKDGIFKHNRALMRADADNSELVRDHIAPAKGGKVSTTKMCGQCRGFFSESYMWRHKLICARNSDLSVDSLPIPTVPTALLKHSSDQSDPSEPSEFDREVLPYLSNDEVGILCRTDPMVLVFGKQEWEKSVKADKKPVRNYMRQMAHLIIECRNITTSAFTGADLFNRTNFKVLTKALDNLTKGTEGEMKHSRKLAYANTIKSASKTIMATFMINDELEKAKEVERFRVVLDNSWAPIINRATYHVQKRGQELLRQPKQLPLENDLEKIAEYIKEQLPQLMKEEMTHNLFNRIRAMLVTRITLFNGRRGGECAKMTLLDFQKSEDDIWVDERRKTELYPHEVELIDQFKLAYLDGKCRKMVPVLIPKNCLPAMRRLVSTRSDMDIHPANPYLFPAGRKSKDHVPGNQAIAAICSAAKTSRPVTATEVRHSISTYYACQDLPDHHRRRFYEHMGHSENINKNVYQAPLVFEEITMVGKHLIEFDKHQGKTVVREDPPVTMTTGTADEEEDYNPVTG
jgi:integrase